MIYNSANDFDIQKAKERFNYLIAKECSFELSEKRKKRSYKQNSYLHLILSFWLGAWIYIGRVKSIIQEA